MQGVHDVDLNLLVTLDVLLAERHVTRAAHRLGITQPAASHALARLRDTLGDPLLVRGPGGTLVPTPVAERIGPHIHRILGELGAVLRDEGFDPASARRAFHIGTSDYVSLVMLPALTARLAAAAPGVDLWVHTFADYGDAELAAGTLDAVIAPPRTTARPAGSYERMLYEERFVCVLRAAHPLADARLTLKRYCELPHLMVAPRGTPGSLVDDALAAVGRSRRVAVAVPHFLVVPYVIAGTDLVATLASRVAEVFARTLDLVVLPPPVEIAPFKLSLAWHERTHGDAGHRWFREQVLAVAQEVR